MATALSINTDLPSLGLHVSSHAGRRSAEADSVSLSSGLRIESARGNVVGQAVRRELKAHVRELAHAQSEANTGVCLMQTAEDALASIDEKLHRLRELAADAVNGRLGANERIAANTELAALRAEIDTVAEGAEFNGERPVNGSLSDGITLDLRTGADPGGRLTLTLPGATTSALGLSSDANLGSAEGAQDALEEFKTSIERVRSQREGLSESSDRLRASMDKLHTAHAQVSAARTRITDAGSAAEMLAQTTAMIAGRSGDAVGAQATQLPTMVARILR